MLAASEKPSRPAGERRDRRGRWCLGPPRRPPGYSGEPTSGGDHLTVHRRFTHGWTTSFLGEAHHAGPVPLTPNRPPTAGPGLGRVTPGGIAGTGRHGSLCALRPICSHPTSTPEAAKAKFRAARARQGPHRCEVTRQRSLRGSVPRAPCRSRAPSGSPRVA